MLSFEDTSRGVSMKMVGMILLCAFLVACGKSESDKSNASGSSSTDSKATELVRSVSGVWSVANSGLITIDFRNDQLQLIVDDEPKYVRLGDVDVANETVNLILKRTSDQKDIIWTLHRIWDTNKVSYHLELILDNGSRDELSFVRTITADDVNRIANLYSRSPNDTDVSTAAGQVENSGSPAPQPTEPAPASSSDNGPATPSADSDQAQISNIPPSFDCTRAKSATEGMICANPELSADDAKMVTLYQQSISSGNADEIQDVQRYWIKFVRNKCTDVVCLKSAYDRRTAQLTIEAADSPTIVIPTASRQTVVGQFYQALGRGDGEAASNFIIPEKRDAGPLSPTELSSFYANLRSPLILDGIEIVGDNQATVRYRYTESNGRSCTGYSVITFVQRDSNTFMAKIEAPNGC